MRNKIIVFFAAYVASFQGLLLFVTALSESTDRDAVGTFITGALLLLIGVVFAKILKRIIRKYRPKDNAKLFVPHDVYAFPSGHTTGISVMVLFIFEKDIALGILAGVLGFLVIAARMILKAHDYIDIVGGFVLGAAVIYFLSTPIEQGVLEYLSTHMF